MGEGRSKGELQLFPRFLHHWLFGRALVAGLALGCYVNSCWGDFVFDDSEAVVNNQDVDPGASSLAEVFSHDFWGENISSKTSHKSYRPLTVLSFRLSFWLAGGRDTFHFHLANVLLHPLVCLLLLELLNNWFYQLKTRSKPVTGLGWQASICSSEALLTTLLFAVHPIHTESVSGVVGRAELASAVLFFSSILAYPSPSAQGGRVVEVVRLLLTLVLAGSAMLFKEQGITALGVCIVSDVIFCSKKVNDGQVNNRALPWYSWEGRRMRKTCLRAAGLCVGGAGLVWARFAVMTTGAPQFKPIDNPASFSESWITRTLSYNYLYSLNWWLLCHPWWLCFDWSMGCIPLVHKMADVRTIAIAVFWAVLAALVFRGLSRLHTREGRVLECLQNFRTDKALHWIVALSLSLLALPFLPASNLFFTVGFVVAERVLYLSTAGHCMLVATGAAATATYSSLMKRVVQVFLVYLTVFHTLRSVHRSSQWLTEESLFVSGLQVCPLNAKVYYNVGKVLTDAGLSDRGEAAYKEAIRLYPEYDQALNNLANLVKESNRLEEAEMYLERALKSNGEFAAAWMNLGIVQAALNKTQEAEVSYKKAIIHRRKYPDAYYNMGNLYIDMGLAREAISAFSKAISLDQHHTNAWTNLGLLYEDLNMNKEAEAVWREALSIMPNKPRFYFSLGVLLGKLQRLEEGEEYLAKAVEMRPNLAKYHVNLGVIYHLQKRYELAESSYRTALQLEPGMPSAEDNLRKLHQTLSKLSKQS